MFTSEWIAENYSAVIFSLFFYCSFNNLNWKKLKQYTTEKEIKKKIYKFSLCNIVTINSLILIKECMCVSDWPMINWENYVWNGYKKDKFKSNVDDYTMLSVQLIFRSKCDKNR